MFRVYYYLLLFSYFGSCLALKELILENDTPHCVKLNFYIKESFARGYFTRSVNSWIAEGDALALGLSNKYRYLKIQAEYCDKITSEAAQAINEGKLQEHPKAFGNSFIFEMPDCYYIDLLHRDLPGTLTVKIIDDVYEKRPRVIMPEDLKSLQQEISEQNKQSFATMTGEEESLSSENKKINEKECTNSAENNKTKKNWCCNCTVQ